jgi:hypothetical protein
VWILSLFHDECLLETAAKSNPLVPGGGHTLLSRDILFGGGILLGVNITLLHILTLISDLFDSSFLVFLFVGQERSAHVFVL